MHYMPTCTVRVHIKCIITILYIYIKNGNSFSIRLESQNPWYKKKKKVKRFWALFYLIYYETLSNVFIQLRLKKSSTANFQQYVLYVVVKSSIQIIYHMRFNIILCTHTHIKYISCTRTVKRFADLILCEDCEKSSTFQFSILYFRYVFFRLAKSIIWYVFIGYMKLRAY